MVLSWAKSWKDQYKNINYHEEKRFIFFTSHIYIFFFYLQHVFLQLIKPKMEQDWDAKHCPVIGALLRLIRPGVSTATHTYILHS